MTHAEEQESIDSQIMHYVSSLSGKNKRAVLTVVKTIAGAEADAEFERKWAQGIPLEEARQHTLNTVRKLFDAKNNSKKRGSSVLR